MNSLRDFTAEAPTELVEALRDLTRDLLWYGRFNLNDYARRYLGDPLAADTPSRQSVEAIAGSFERLLADGEVALGAQHAGLYDWDGERQPIDRIVIHHSAYRDGIALPALSALELVRVYIPAYTAPAPDDRPRIANKPIYSGHFDNGRQVFYPYHWLIGQDGHAQHLLQDDQIGWHAGDWEINRSSIAICFDADLTDGRPSSMMLDAAARIIGRYRDTVDLGADTIAGHSAVSGSTECPGAMFDEPEGWKAELLRRIT